MSRQKYKAEEVAEALLETGGVIAEAARLLGCDRKTVYNYIDRYVTVQEAQAQATETTLDTAEAGLAAYVRGELTLPGGQAIPVDPRLRLDAIKFMLRTKGRRRGYGDREAADPKEEGRRSLDEFTKGMRAVREKYDLSVYDNAA